MTQYEHHELKRIDAEIAELERKIAVKNEQRREIINRKDLNKNEEVSGINVHIVIRKTDICEFVRLRDL
jgi:restriction endonuclease S subunit